MSTIVVLLLISTLAMSQGNFGSPEVRSFTRTEYNAQRQNWSIAQSPQTGFLYFANSQGLLEYDGGMWRMYPFPTILRSVCIDKKGRIFTGAQGEFGLWEKQANGKLKYRSLKEKISEPNFNREPIWNIVEIPEGIVFQSFAYAFLLKHNDEIQKIALPSNIHFLTVVGGQLFAPAIDGGILQYKYSGHQFSELPATKQFFKDKSAIAILASDKPDEILVGTTEGVYRYTKSGRSEAFGIELNQKLSRFQLNKAVRVAENLFAFGTVQKGLIMTDGAGRIVYELSKENGLTNNTVLAIRVDFEGNIWLGLDSDISMVYVNSPFRHFLDTEGRLGAVYDAAWFKNQLYLATNQGLFVGKGNASTATFDPVKNVTGQIWNLEIFDDQLICGTNDGTFSIENDIAVPISNITGGWVMKRLKRNPEYIIQGTYTHLLLYSKQQGRWKLDRTLTGFSEPVQQIEEDVKGNIWVKHPLRGISRLTLSEDLKKVTYIQRFNELPALNISYFRDSLFVNTANGVFVYNPDSESFVKKNRLGYKSKLIKFFPNLYKNLAALDENGSLLLQHKGMFRHVSRFDKRFFIEGFENVKVVNNTWLLFCLEDGFAIADKSKLLKNIDVQGATPTVRAFETEGRLNFSKVLDRNSEEVFRFSHADNNIGLYFSPGSFSKSIQYSYRLLQKSKEWSSFQVMPKQWFYNLPPGRYEFQLRSNASPKLSSFRFEILPPWYWNFWSKLFYLALILALCLVIYRFHLRNLEAQQKKLSEKHEKEVEKKQQEIITLRNQQLEVDVIRKSEELANSTMNLIKKNELLGQIKDEITKETGHIDRSPGLVKLVKMLEKGLSDSNDWKVFETNFNQVHESFLKKLSHEYPNLSHGDLQLAAYLRMNLSSKEIAQLLNITYRSVELKRYRLRKKMQIKSDENLNELMIKY